ncbi:MAG: hypothetical protein RL722_2100 [Pseudomonadota bacterium]
MFAWSVHRQSSGWVAIAPTGALAHAAHVVRREDGRPALRWAASTDWTDPARGLDQLRPHLRGQRRIGLLQRQQYQLLPLDAPEVPREAWRDAVRWKLKDMVDFPVEDAGVDLLEIPPETSPRGRSSLLAAIAPAQALQPLMHAGEDAGLPWQALDLPETALRNLSQLAEVGPPNVPANVPAAAAEGPGRAQALLGITDAGSWLVVTVGGELLLSRAIELSRDATLAPPQDETAHAAWDRVVLELQRSLDHCERLFSRVGITRLLVGPAPAPDFLAYLQSLVYLPVQPYELADWVDLSAVPGLQDDASAQARYFCAIGAALRPEGDHGR